MFSTVHSLLLILAVATATLALVPVSAQDGGGTIADLDQDGAFLAAHDCAGQELAGSETTLKDTEIAMIVIGSVCLVLLVIIIVF